MSDYYCKCKNCEYIDPTERSGYKWYCKSYGSYEDPDKVRECRRYKKSGSSGGCYLTSACVEAKGLPDDCHELTALRKFRDEYVAKCERGKEDIAHYYAAAPKVVDRINKKENAKSIWEEVYNSMVLPCVKLIDESCFDEAYKLYKAKSMKLEAAY